MHKYVAAVATKYYYKAYENRLFITLKSLSHNFTFLSYNMSNHEVI